MLFNSKWLAALFEEHDDNIDLEINISEVNTDSRAQMNQALFIPLVGDNFDGHDYIEQAIHNGSVAIMCSQGTKLPDFLPDGFPVFFVDDTLLGLQMLAAYYRQEINPVVIGITGSNGKTTTKDLVASVLKTSYKTHETKGNFNNHIGLPLTILSMSTDTEVLVLEMGMSDFGEIEKLSKIAKPDYGIITNIGESHIEYLGSRRGILKAKLEILCGMSEEAYLIIDGDEELFTSLSSRDQVIKCGFTNNNDVMIRHTKILMNETQFTIGNHESYNIPLLGKHHAQNATYAIILAKKLNITNTNIKKGLKDLKVTGMRFESFTGMNDVSIINDAYNASPTSMKAAIEVVKQMEGYHEKVLILGDVLELGDHSERLHQSISDVIGSPITALFTYGTEAQFISGCVKEKENNIVCTHFDSRDKLLDALEPYLRKHNLLLFKASRSMYFETFIEKIQS